MNNNNDNQTELTPDGQTKKRIFPKNEKLRLREQSMLLSIYPEKFRDSNYLNSAGLEVTGLGGCVEERGATAPATPINNMGVKSTDTGIAGYMAVDDHIDFGLEDVQIRSKGQKGHTEFVFIPRKQLDVDARIGFVDQVSFTVRVGEVMTREFNAPYQPSKTYMSQNDAVMRVSSSLMQIFGIAVTHPLEKGVNFYKFSYSLGEKDGILSAGGQNDTINVQLYGQGCRKALAGWEARLQTYLQTMQGWITRIDIAADYFSGQYSVERAEADYLQGLFTGNGRPPLAERRGDWYNLRGGRTFYVGRRTSGKLCRIYEKGLQLLGSIAANMIDEAHKLAHLKAWVRIEVEWHNTNRVCPLDMLTDSGKYLAGAYPAFNHISDKQEVVETKTNSALLTIERKIQWVKNTCGPTLFTMVQLFGEQVLLTFQREKLLKLVSEFGALIDPSDMLNSIYIRSVESELAEIDAIPF